MNKPTVGIIGGGFVGGAVARAFNLSVNLRIYDIQKRLATHSLEDTCNSEYVFICVPTPMGIKGECNTSIVDSVCADIYENSQNNPICLIKSTVPIGTTTYLRNKYNLRLLFNPEFLTERNADIDYLTANRNIVGGEPEDADKAAELFEHRFPGKSFIKMTSEESEAIKYIVNCFLATKVLFFNEIKLGLCDTYGLDYDRVIGQVMGDGRIAHSHTQVPGHDGKYGYGGTCFPKDINALIAQIEKKNFDPKLLKACWEQNTQIREIKIQEKT